MTQFDAFYVFRAGGARIAANDMNDCHSIDKNEARVYLKNSLRLNHGVFSAISASENLDLAPLNLRFSSLN